MPTNSRFGKEAFVRIESFPDKRRSVVVAEEERLVHFLFDENDNIIECSASKRIQYLLDHLMAEVARFEETSVMPDNVIYAEPTVDVGWYGRYCRRWMRDQLRDVELGESEIEESRLQQLVDTSWIEKGVPGTNFCTRRLPSHAFMNRNIGEERELDTCCMGLWSCDPRDLPLMPLHYAYNKLNSGHWPLWSCQCLQNFITCLSETKSSSELVERVRSVFSKYGMKCFSKYEEHDSCEEYDLWFNQCLRGNRTEYIKINSLSF